MKKIWSLLMLLLLIAFSAMTPTITPAQEQRTRGLKVGATREDLKKGQNVKLWALLIGVSRYQYGDQNLAGYQISNLKNAADDAQAIHDFLRSDEGGGFRDIDEGGNMILLKDEEATRENILKALNTIKQAQPNDYFVIYIAAHGALIPVRDTKANVTTDIPYFVLYDTDLRNIQNSGLRMEEFRNQISKIPAKKGLVLSDTCHSAGVQMAGRDTSATSLRANVRYIEEMGKISSGIGFISAADQLEQSYELDELNHGVFTYTLLEALRGNADDDENGVVTFNELSGYLREEVPKLTDQKQHPHYNTTAIEANYLPLSLVRYTDSIDAGGNGNEYGTLVIRTPDVDGVEIAVDGNSIGALNSNGERTVKVRTGARRLSFSKGNFHRDLQETVEPGRSKLVEINLSFSESDDDALIAPNKQQLNVYLSEDRIPTKEAKELFLKGVDSFSRQRFDAAAQLFTRAIQANGNAYADAFVYRGRAEQSLGRKEAAIVSFNAALTLRPSDFETRTLLAEAEFNAGYNVNKIVAELQSIIRKHPYFEFARVVLGDILFWRQDFIGAERQLRRAILINLQSPPAHMILADLLTHQASPDKLREAVREAETALKLFTEVSKKQLSVARGLKRLSISHVIFGGARYFNNAAMAEANQIYAKTIIRLIERDESFSERDSYLARAREHLTSATTFAEQAGDKRRLVLIKETSAEAYLLSGDLNRAIEDGEQALKLSEAHPDLTGFPEAHYTLYAAYLSKQKFIKAAEHLQKFIDKYGTHLSAAEKENYLQEITRLKRAGEANRQEK